MSSDIDFVSAKSAKDTSESFQIVSHASAHKMHRSAVRPFFCCGSQLSLVSMNDIIPSMAISEITELSDNDEDLELMVTEVKGYRKNFNLKRSKKTDLEKTPRKRFWSKVVKSQKTRPKLEKEVCTCTSFKKKDDKTNFLASSTILPHSSESSLSPVSTSSKSLDEASALASAVQNEHLHLHPNHHLLDFEDMYPSEDVDERRREERAREMEQGVSLDVNEIVDNVVTPHLRQCLISDSMSHLLDTNELFSSLLLDRDEVYEDEHRDHRYSLEVNIPVPVPVDTSKSRPVFMPSHSQVDYMHCLVPDIQEITNCSFYWGIMDRYQAEKLLENKPEGTFLLRDSAQEEFLFSVSFRRYGRSLHARIEQWNHKFSFDSHDPGVFASDTVCGLIEHYKDPSCCMFFEPMLISPLMRNFTFSLQHMCRAAICKNLNYDGINQLPLPRSLREYLQFYHYRQKIRVRRFDTQA